MKICNLLCAFTILGIVKTCASYRVLGIYALPVPSHFILMNRLFIGLTEKGHKVDIVSTLSLQEENPNYTQIIKLSNVVASYDKGVTYETAKSFNTLVTTFPNIGYDVCKNLGNPEFLKLARNPPKDPPYDAIIVQMMNYHCFTVLGYLWNIPVILISTTSLYPWMHDMIGNPENIAFSPSNLSEMKLDNNFWSRFSNAFRFYLLKFTYLYGIKKQNQLLKEYFGPNAPSIEDLEKNASLVLVNSFFPINGVKPSTTALVEVGGIHIKEKGPTLTDDLKKWLDESKNGVIYFSFGSFIRIETFPKEILTIIFKTFKDIAPTRVLMRITDNTNLSLSIPDNVHILPWIRQQEVLKHPNTKAFITHGGLLGTQESIYFGVPMLCVPFFADQFTNCHNYVEKKIGLIINHNSITQDTFDYVVHEILNNPIYGNNIKKISNLFKDRPQSPMETAIFWTEYVIRNGKYSLRSEAMNLTWWQLALLDVYVVAFSLLLITLLVIFIIIKQLFYLLFYWRNNGISKHKKHS